MQEPEEADEQKLCRLGILGTTKSRYLPAEGSNTTSHGGDGVRFLLLHAAHISPKRWREIPVGVPSTFRSTNCWFLSDSAVALTGDDFVECVSSDHLLGVVLEFIGNVNT